MASTQRASGAHPASLGIGLLLGLACWMLAVPVTRASTRFVNCDLPCAEGCLVTCPDGCVDNCPTPCICPVGCLPGAPDCPLECETSCPSYCPPDGTQQRPFSTIPAAQAASVPGDTIQVLPTTDDCDPLVDPCACVGNVQLQSGVELLGSGASVTTILGDGTGPVVSGTALAAGTRLDGFTVSGGGGASGSAVRLVFGGPTISNSVLTLNSAAGTSTVPGRGGGIYLYATTATVTDNVISYNEAGTDAAEYGGNGGGVFSVLGTPLIARNMIVGNVARTSADAYSIYVFGYGGGIELQAGAASVRDNLILDNVARLGGGGIDVYGGAHVITNNTIHANRAEPPVAAPPGFSYGGGMEIVSATSPVILNNLFTENIARDGGGGLDAYPPPGGSMLRFEANNMFGNQALDDPATDDYSGLRVCDDSSPNPGATCSDDSVCTDGMISGTCQDGATGVAGNTAVDPFYVNAAGGDFNLGAASPVIDIGLDVLREFGPGPDGILGTPDDQLTFLARIGTVDLAGKPRTLDGNGVPGPPDTDMGALEYQVGPAGDPDGDGVLDDGDASGTPGDNRCSGGSSVGCDDNCPALSNASQADGDADGVGDVCDACPVDADPDQGDIDSDGRGDVCDPDRDNDQILDDGDASGTAGDNPCTGGNATDCDDNCPSLSNQTQADADADGTGDACDCAPNDPSESTPPGNVGDTLAFTSPTMVAWDATANTDSYSLYRGNLATLLGLGEYTQDVGVVPGAAQFCGLTIASQDDPFEPALEEAVFYLVSPKNACGELILGVDSAGVIRPNDFPCP